MRQIQSYRGLHLLPILAVMFLATGCTEEKNIPAQITRFEPNLVHSTKYQIQNDLPMDQASEDAFWVVETMFGTPDNPTMPQVILDDEDFASMVSMDNLQRASGPENAEGRGLYRLLCASCHGVSGNGRGPVGADQMPYPRDYRMGVFKFKSTERGSKPTKNDLRGLITHGIAGTNMTSVQQLLDLEKLKRGPAAESWLPERITDEDIDALVDYVIYLSFRGEHERTQVDMGILEGIIEGGDRLINADIGKRLDWSNRENRSALDEQIESLDEKDELTEQDEAQLEDLERFQEEWKFAEEYAIDIADAWLNAEDEVIEVPSPPDTIPVPASLQEMTQLLEGEKAVADALNASINRGRQVFVGKVAACSKCHGEKGLGNGQTTDYDDWTKDWTSRVGLKPENLDELVPLLARGALKPQNAMPRNFAEGIFRGGSRPEDLYRRIIQGIEGSPMPAATFVNGEFEEDDIWHLINFVRSLSQKSDSEILTKSTSDQVTASDTSVNSSKS
ncbi:MAG: c-type cytochrome [Rubripirellula sp.]